MSIIQVKNLSKSYKYYRKQPGLLGTIKSLFKKKKLFIEAVKNVNFDIKEGELVGFLGPNGAGKTTTLKMLSGITEPSNGAISVLDYNPTDRQLEYRKEFALVMGQKNQLDSNLPAMDSFILTKEIYEIPDKEFKKNLNELTHLLCIDGILDIQVRKLSLGQRMKCEIVAALIHNPKVLFLDEPTIGLDVVAQKNIRDFIKKYNKQKKTTIILTSHYMDDIKKLCKRVIIISLGKIIYDGSFDNLVKKYAPHKILKLTFGDKVGKKQVESYGKIIDFDEYSVSIEVTRDKVKDMIFEILSSNLPINDISIDEIGVDKIIRKIFSN